ncbi:uncharacterized protein [Physcomitrium patens]|uniref:AP2/ERF domain-containing protein n=1 Tax=Physcomitrium patens TaxID=3218 RepID=A0A7I4AJW1_PHYPA|nr:uncharacterized protein LOC112290447 [Physcomitrium patens]XP_024392440.1 uncharacterized protein LOC112290447 [Physcomitrium patens]XP_024392441.1 uncharacterized protein LOC112290447 [Physcomitrium patens]XP_024392442.1 uncharacterized protein LOC112290447 [Physcomitrium patens]XP_024392443.1 uncharacterized protein LOC112290447 [Physcomitrium patens]XP_024392444.1 uncharacterized protein LOC112290447 [Physcomitrium patens]XP_024392445.1 uncharacterized protein LOC112290447 [Physcomitriu|eukprot:XP_024392439.1 uncharacterized protein LOC112290447 [Physcomitrella patens]
MPEILPSGNTKIINSLRCFECARSGSTDCIDHGGNPSEDSFTSVLGKRQVFLCSTTDFQGFCKDGGKNPFTHSTKRLVAASSALSRTELSSTSPKVVIPTPTRPSVSLPPVAPVAPVASVAPETPTVSSQGASTPSGSDTPSDHGREQVVDRTDQDIDDSSCKEGGVRYRESVGKYVVEYRPTRFKWKLWMGTYSTVDEGRRACDCARFYAGQDKGGFYFKDSPALFGELGPLNRPFTLVSKETKDRAFNAELKNRAKIVIRKVFDAQRGKKVVDVSRPSPSASPLLANIERRILAPNATRIRDPITGPAQEHFSLLARLATSSQENVIKTGATQEQLGVLDELLTFHQDSLLKTDFGEEQPSTPNQQNPALSARAHEDNETGQSSQEAADASDDDAGTYASLDPLDASLDLRDLDTEYPSPFNIAFNYSTSTDPLSFMNSYADEVDPVYVSLWTHEN